MKRSIAVVRSLILGAALASLPQAAAAQGSPAPVGLWQGQNSGDHIWVKPNGECSASGTVNVSGSCTWNPTSAGGILTMTYQWVRGPGQIHWSVIWIDRNVIQVNGVER